MNSTVNKTLAVLGGIGAGAAAMYFLDPDRGRTRRALMKDKAVGLTHDAKDAITGKAKDLKNRAVGLAHDAKGMIGNGGSTKQHSQAGFTAHETDSPGVI
ncbi:MAG TPA: hypothetical protein VFZ49_08275 [Pyrinomonadaceae bacterium]